MSTEMPEGREVKKLVELPPMRPLRADALDENPEENGNDCE